MFQAGLIDVAHQLQVASRKLTEVAYHVRAPVSATKHSNVYLSVHSLFLTDAHACYADAAKVFPAISAPTRAAARPLGLALNLQMPSFPSECLASEPAAQEPS